MLTIVIKIQLLSCRVELEIDSGYFPDGEKYSPFDGVKEDWIGLVTGMELGVFRLMNEANSTDQLI